MGLYSLHLGDAAGVGWTLARNLSSLGYPSRAIALARTPEMFPTDRTLDMTTATLYPVRVLNASRILLMATESKLLHFHFGIPRFAHTIRKLCDSPIFVHFHGSDLREHLADDNRHLAVQEFVSTPDLLVLAPNAIWIPNPVDLPTTRSSAEHARPLVGHFPTNTERKGTEDIVAAAGRLRRELEFDFQVVSGVSHAKALQVMSECDVVVDQLTDYGVYGNVAVEGMLLGKVVLSSVNLDLYDRCPIVPITHATVESRLADVLTGPSRWPEYGKAGKAYATRVHDPRRVAERLLGTYRKFV